MPGSRLEKIGTIYSRAAALIQTKALKWEDRPLWFDIYKAFPPKEEPVYSRPVNPDLKLRQIFYEDDKIRVLFHRNNKRIGIVNLQGKSDTLTQKFIETYKKVVEQYKDSNVTEETLYKEAIDILNKDKIVQAAPVHNAEDDAATISLSAAFKDAQNKQKDIGVSIKDIFKV